MSQYDVLFEPLQVGSITLKNRVMMVPMEGTCIIGWLKGHGFEEEKREFYLERAKDGIGLMVPGCVPLKSMIGGKWLHEHPEVFEPIKPFMDELHAHNAKLFLQISAGWGRSFIMNSKFAKIQKNPILRFLMKRKLNFGNWLVAPDEGAPNVWMPEFKCRQITRKEIKEYVHAYAQTALLAKKAGIDGVEVHAVHEGYLMDQFTMPYTNHRTDEYGGSFENRYRFAVEVVQEIKRVCGEDFPVSLRFSVTSKTKGYNDGAVPGEDFVEVGRDLEEAKRAIKYLSDAGYDMFSCDNGTYDAWYWAHPPVYMPLNCNLEDVEAVKPYTDKPVFCAGRMQFDTGAASVAAGKIDGVGIGRQFLTDAQALTKLRAGKQEEIKPCISCHIGCLPPYHYKGVGFELPEDMSGSGHCALNPRTLSECKYAVKPAANPKRIAVIGGGIGGMEAAIQAAKRGHTVDLFEKSNVLGGVFRAAAAPEFKEKDKDLIEWYKGELSRHPVTVHMNEEIKDITDLQADEIIVAVGARPITLPLPGWDKTVNAEDYLLGNATVGDKVAIIGGGITGCEVAYDLALKGKHPVIVELADDLMKTNAVAAPNSIMLRDLIKFHKIPTYLEASAKEIRDGSVVIKTKSGNVEIPADSVISSVGYKPCAPLFQGKQPKNVHIIGDAKEVANLKAAIWAANDLIVKLSK